MAKSQKRSNREVRKPKANNAKLPAAVGLAPAHPVNTLLNKPKDKL